nr:hypothetical protein [Tanacetum cinerariifolium]
MELQEHYAQIDGHRIYQLSNDMVQLKQENSSVEVYYQKWKGVWDEFDALEAPYLCLCICSYANGRINGERNQRKRLIQFLMRLDECYSNIRGQILLMQPLPNATKAYTMVRQEEKQREEAMNKELQALEANKTWELILLPPNKIPIGCKWVYRIKFHADGIIERHRARALLVLAVHHNWFIEQLDINNAFLHGDLHEEVYMTIPQGYSKQLPPNTVCKLTKSIYGLKQANRQWFHKLTTFLLTIGFQHCYANTSLFTLTEGSYFTILLVYVDDILIAELLKCGNVLNDKPISTPLDPIQNLNLTDGEPLSDPSLYKTLVGKLIYLIITRPDISFAAQLLSKFSQASMTPYMKTLLRVLRYIKLCPGPVSRSYTEAEYRALADCTCEITWLKCLFKELKLSVQDPIVMKKARSNRYMSDLETSKISKSVFISNFLDDCTNRNIWKVCNDYGTVVDVFIPNKKSKAGKRFAFVRFIKVFWARAKELFVWSPSFKEVPEKVICSDDESVKINEEANSLNNGVEESDSDVVSDTYFGDNGEDQGLEHQHGESSNAKEVSSDPFKIYGLLDKRIKEVRTTDTTTSIPYPPGFTPVNEIPASIKQDAPEVESDRHPNRSKGVIREFWKRFRILWIKVILKVLIMGLSSRKAVLFWRF